MAASCGYRGTWTALRLSEPPACRRRRLTRARKPSCGLPPARGRAWRRMARYIPANASVDLGEEDRDAAGGEVRDVVDGRLPVLGTEACLKRVHVLERELGDALVGD